MKPASRLPWDVIEQDGRVLVRVTPNKVRLPVKVMDCGPVDDPDAWEDAKFVCWAVNQYQRKRGSSA